MYTLLVSLAVSVHAASIHLRGTVLPSVVADIGGVGFYTWVLMLYIIAAIIGTACGGRLQVTLGFRRGYLVGGLIVLVGVLGCGGAFHIAGLLLASAIQGLGSGLLLSLAYGMVSALYPEVLRPRVLSVMSGLWGVSAFLGPTLGGMFAGMGWWRGAFWSAVPLLILLGILAWYTLPSASPTQTVKRLPALRLFLLAAGVLCVASSSQVTILGPRLALVGSACVLVAMTFHLDSRAHHRLFPSRPLTLTTPVGTVSWMLVLIGMTTTQVTVFMPLIVQILYGLSPLSAGYFTAILSFSWTALALISAGWQGRRVQAAIALGLLGVTCGVVGLWFGISMGSLIFLAIFITLTSVGVGVCFAHISSWTIAAARSGEADLTASSIPLLQSLGIAFGAAVAGIAANTAGLEHGVSPDTVTAAATWVYGLGTIAPILCTGLAIRLLWLHANDKLGQN